MKKFAFSSLLIIGTLSLFLKSWMDTEEIQINLNEEDSHLYL
ncbi:hypothetical protein [Adhaeribacter swui]|nr:hypothetical protein [Adhaeribacter swui]